MNSQQIECLLWLEPDVVGELGDSTEITNLAELQNETECVPEIKRFEYRLDFWRGDSVLTCHPCHVVTRALFEELRNCGLSGVDSLPVQISTSENFEATSPQVDLPEFVRLRPQGRISVLRRKLTFSKGVSVLDWTGHDVCLGPRAELVLSQRAIEVIGIDRIPNAVVTPIVVVTKK